MTAGCDCAGDVPHWQRVRALLAEALELDAEARPAFVHTASGSDTALRGELPERWSRRRGTGCRARFSLDPEAIQAALRHCEKT